MKSAIDNAQPNQNKEANESNREAEALNFSSSSCSSMSSSANTIKSFVIKTSATEKRKLDLQVAKFIYATNSPFKHVEHPEFKKLMEVLRPGYKPPNRQQIGNDLLEKVYETALFDLKRNLKNKVVCMSQDGWSNIRNESIVCTSVTDIIDKHVYLIDTVDTMESSHTADYLLSILCQSIKRCEQFGCKVGSVVTDNAANMVKMRSELAKVENLGMPDIITYGCSAHILNLLAHDMDIPKITEHTKKVIKYFKYTHFAASVYKSAGGKALVLPQDVRWNSLCKCFESYLDNWHILSKVCSENRVAIDGIIAAKVQDINLKTNVHDYYTKLKKIQAALDRIQSNTCTLSECTDVWLHLIQEFESEPQFTEADLKYAKQRFNMAITPAHYVAHLLDHRFCGQGLSNDQLDIAMEFITNYSPDALPDILSYKAKTTPFKDYLFSEVAVKNVTPLTWWLSMRGCVSEETIELCKKLFTAVASSAGIERLFSSFGLVHSKLRNRLGTEKASKLVTVMKVFNNNVPLEEEF